MVETKIKAEKASCIKDCIVPNWGFINNLVAMSLEDLILLEL